MTRLPPPSGERYVPGPWDDMDRHPASRGFFWHLAIDCGLGFPDEQTANQWMHDWCDDKRARRDRSNRYGRTGAPAARSMRVG